MGFLGLDPTLSDEALKYAKERVQGGVPIFEHQNIKLQLFGRRGFELTTADGPANMNS